MACPAYLSNHSCPVAFVPRLWKGGHVDLPDWNRTAVQRLIADAEDALSLLESTVSEPTLEVRMRAMRNGRRAFKDIGRRRRSFLLTPHDAATLERLLEAIKARLRFLRERPLYGPK
jgi:hypothetical protein